MSKHNLIFDEVKFPIAWRFNSTDCLLTEEDKKKVILLEKTESESLWEYFIPIDKLVDIDNEKFVVEQKIELDFDDERSKLFFNEKLNNISFICFFWGRFSAAFVPKDIFVKSWNDFFYPSDESSILISPNHEKSIFSFEETFFYGRFEYKEFNSCLKGK